MAPNNIRKGCMWNHYVESCSQSSQVQLAACDALHGDGLRPRRIQFGQKEKTLCGITRRPWTQVQIGGPAACDALRVFLASHENRKNVPICQKCTQAPRKKGFSCSAQLLCSTCATLLALLFVFSHCHEHTYRNRNNFSASCLNGIHGHTLNLHLSTPYWHFLMKNIRENDKKLVGYDSWKIVHLFLRPLNVYGTENYLPSSTLWNFMNEFISQRKVFKKLEGNQASARALSRARQQKSH